jgi:hypothetical protein
VAYVALLAIAASAPKGPCVVQISGPVCPTHVRTLKGLISKIYKGLITVLIEIHEYVFNHPDRRGGDCFSTPSCIIVISIR